LLQDPAAAISGHRSSATVATRNYHLLCAIFGHWAKPMCKGLGPKAAHALFIQFLFSDFVFLIYKFQKLLQTSQNA
jgi:hypothetical protein